MITVFFNGESEMKSNTKIALILTASVISCSAFAQSVSAPKTDSLLSNILGEQVQTNQHLVQLLAKYQDAGITLTPEQKKTSCLYESHYYSSGASLTVGKETLRCTLSGEIPTWENANEGNIVSVEGK
ncbi:DUF1496 domain-containing protein [Klebsiella pneumoniae]|uniref:DUF1496 domain-containing protein n=1 Tax=Klebsiella pneumoniae TaxID=573 RepID=UPI0023811C26|nr:DUF1496 domain-containing protein [Klebsiella pneumoniae]MDE4720014.1 DUF1496 domain-containing protein [Klebsiella pneumoniae]MDE4842531.1 DUF1496 domain-containing protein [Klebsiella pneumoniae]MDE4854429.1 DUF1496 domain-containing protein [Klebsiella pneumoniae]